MLLVRKVVIDKILTERGNVEIIDHQLAMMNHYQNPDISYEPPAMERELIQGQRFTNARRETFIIGYTRDVENAIGLPMSIFGDMKKELDKYERQLDRFKSLSLWERLLFVFSKQKIYKL